MHHYTTVEELLLIIKTMQQKLHTLAWESWHYSIILQRWMKENIVLLCIEMINVSFLATQFETGSLPNILLIEIESRIILATLNLFADWNQECTSCTNHHSLFLRNG